jgi:putative chitinase
MITTELLRMLCPNTRASVLESFIEPLNDIAEYYEMFADSRRISAFLAQIAHESGGFTAIKENLNYSYSGLMTTFKKYFPTEALARQYQRNPEKIANRVYANRMGNGNELSGDGYKYCGRGLIQLTGKYNYTQLAAALDMSIEDTVAYLETPVGAVSSAGWFWDCNNLNEYADKEDFIGMTKRINGGTIGIADRQRLYNSVLELRERE